VETRAKLSQLKSAAGEAASAIESSYATVKNGAIEFNTKAVEAFKATAEANFEFVKSVIGAKTPSEYVTLHSEFARKQFEALQTQTKSFGELAQKIATDSVEPIKAQVAKTFNLPL
jgi:phasin